MGQVKGVGHTVSTILLVELKQSGYSHFRAMAKYLELISTYSLALGNFHWKRSTNVYAARLAIHSKTIDKERGGEYEK